MKVLVVLTVVVAMAAAAEINRGKPDLDKEWEDFKSKHGKKYKHAAEEAERRKIWEAKRDMIAKHNQEATAGLHTYMMAINHLSDRTPEELENLARAFSTTAGKPRTPSTAFNTSLQSDLRQVRSVDLRNDSCMPPVKDQRDCGSFWAFAATTPVEWRLCKKNNNNLVLLSEQQLLDCSWDYHNFGCSGGYYLFAWNYIKDNGQAKNSAYPYTAQGGYDGSCSYSPSQSTGSLKGYVKLDAGVSESQIRAAIDQNGPVAAALHIFMKTFANYKSGVYTDATCSKDGMSVNHAVVLVGYGSQDGIGYWILRNSWSSGWGQQGYMRIRRGTNECNIESIVAFPTF